MARRADDVPSWHWFGENAGGARESEEPTARVRGPDAAGSPQPWPAQPSGDPAQPAGADGPSPVTGSDQPAAAPTEGDTDRRAGRPSHYRPYGSSQYLPFGQPPPPRPTAPIADPATEEVAAALRQYGDAETMHIPRVANYETAIIPKVPRQPDRPPTLSQLAAKYGLRPAGTRPRLGEYARELWRFREFIAYYANARLIASVGKARLGQLWLVLTPLFNAAVYFVIFGMVLRLGRDVDNFVAYLVAGFMVFNYTTAVAQESVASISGQLGLVRAMQFPRASLPIATIIMQLQNFLIAQVVLLVIVVATGEPVRFAWVWLVPAMVLHTLFNTGLALTLARIGAKIADARQIVPFVMRIWMYMSALFYSVTFYETLPEPIGTIVQWNPLLTYIELVRYCVMENPPLSSSFTELWIKGVAWSVLLLVVGYVYFSRGEAEYGRG